MKKILLLGGSAQQVIAIEKAKKLGYYTILCDFLPDNPGQYVADKFYLESTTDKDVILKIAEKEKIDGILAYASDPAAPTAAYVAEKLNLPGNSYESVEILCNKDKFRLFLNEEGFCTPQSYAYSDRNHAVDDIDKYSLPVIVKPVDSSGSKGTTVVWNYSELPAAIDFAFRFSMSHRIIIENFIDKDHKYLVGGDIFVVDGNVKLWGLMNCHRDYNANPLVPVGKSYPPLIKDSYLKSIKDTLRLIVKKLGFKNGAINVELVVDKLGRVWPIDIGPRSGGNMIPDLLSYIFNVDVVEMSILAAMGENISINTDNSVKYMATHNLHSVKDGIYCDIEFDDYVSKFIIKKCFYKNIGDTVSFFDNASKALGIIFLKFSDEDTMLNVLDNINNNIKIILK